MSYKNPADEKAWRLKNRHKKLAYMRQYHLKNADRINARSREWYAENKERAATRNSAYAKAHPEVTRAATARYRAKPETKQKQTEYARKWRGANRDRFNANMRAWVKRKMATDVNFRILNRLRARLHKKLLNRGIYKVKNSMALTGCDAEFLRGYIEGQFTEGMTWDNIHLDHHIPCAAFDLTDPKQQEQCFHYSNLKPLLGPENLKKGKKMPKLKDAE